MHFETTRLRIPANLQRPSVRRPFSKFCFICALVIDWEEEKRLLHAMNPAGAVTERLPTVADVNRSGARFGPSRRSVHDCIAMGRARGKFGLKPSDLEKDVIDSIDCLA